MIDSQKQSVDSGGEAYQARGDINVNKGISTGQLAEIISAVVAEIGRLSSDAARQVEERNQELREELTARIADSEERVRSAFAQPDFQYALGSAFNGYARKGTETLKNELADLIIRRAKSQDDDRVSEVLNQAIAVLPKLSVVDKDVLAILFLFKNLNIIDSSLSNVWVRYESYLSSHVSRIPNGVGTFEYLQGLGCINVNLVADHFPLGERLYNQYQNLVPKKAVDGPPVPGDVPAPKIEMPAMSQSEFVEGLRASSPSFTTLEAVWNDRLFPNSTLTSVGKAIAHSVLSTDGKLQTPVEVFLAMG